MILRGVRNNRRPVSRRDDGYVMITVIGTMLILSILVTMTLNWTTPATKSGRSEQDHNAALAAAQAGVDEYLSRLNANPTYYNVTGSGGRLGRDLPNGEQVPVRRSSASASDIHELGQHRPAVAGTVRGDSAEDHGHASTSRASWTTSTSRSTRRSTRSPPAGGNGACAVFRYSGRNTSHVPGHPVPHR